MTAPVPPSGRDLTHDGIRAASVPDSGTSPPRSAETRSPDDDAADFATRMQPRDRAGRLVGYELEGVGSGWATVTMAVRDEHLNGLDVCHGGLIFTLADTAMAYASNSHGQDAFAVAASIDFLAPGRAGSVLRAEATETFRRGRTALYEIVVTADDGTAVARFHGRTQHPAKPLT